MKATADCAIVGGGVVGLSIAYHLAARGMTDVVVLEREEMVGSGSTGRCAGGFRHQFSNRPNIALSLMSVAKIEGFAEEMEQELDFHQDGYLFLLDSAEDVATFERNIALQTELGIEVELLEPVRIPEVIPGTRLNLEGILAASYCARDGISDPAGMTEGYRRNASRLGVRIETGREVTGIEVREGCVKSVHTRSGAISTPVVINAAGPFAAAVGRMAGVEVPVVPLRRCIWTTRPFAAAPQRWTLVVDFSTGFYFHREGGGVLFGMGNRSEGPTHDLSVDHEFFADVVAPTAAGRYPDLAEAEIQASWAGSYETSPDANAILGRVPEVDGFLLANGFSGHGFQHAPAVGQLLAEEVLDGRARSLDLTPFSLARFSDGAVSAEHGVV